MTICKNIIILYIVTSKYNISRKARKEGIIMKKLGELKLTVAQRSCKCKACGKPLEKGENVYKYFSTIQPKGLTYDVECVNKVNRDFIGSFYTINKEYNSKTTNNHVLTVRGLADDFPYFSSKGFSTFRKVNKNVADYSCYCVNRYTSGHVASTAWNNGLRVWCDGVEIFNFEDLDAITR